MLDREQFNRLWNALWSFKSHAYTVNMHQQINQVNIEAHDSDLIADIFRQEKVAVVTDGIHAVTEDILEEMSDLSTRVDKSDSLEEFWDWAEESLRRSIAHLITGVCQSDSDLEGMEDHLAASQSDYITHYVSYLREKSRFLTQP